MVFFTIALSMPPDHAAVRGFLTQTLFSFGSYGLRWRADDGGFIFRAGKKHFKSKVYATAIPRNVRLGEAPSHGLPIHLYDPRSIGADSYRRLAQEFLQRNK